MKPEQITVYQAHGDSGGETGWGPILAYCTTRAQAEQVSKGRGWYGGDGRIQEVPALRIDGQTWILARDKPVDIDSQQRERDAKLYQETIASLSPEQLRVLGLGAAAALGTPTRSEK